MSYLSRMCLSRNAILSSKCRQRLLDCCFASTASTNKLDYKMVSLKSIPPDELGRSILHRKEHGSPKSATDVMSFGIKCAKICSLGSSFFGIAMIPILSTHLSQGASERPSIMLFIVFANASLGILALTPLLLHSLSRRFVLDVYYNDRTGIFTSVHYNFLLQRRALRFHAEDVVLTENSPTAKKMWIPLATCFVDKHPLLLLLEPEQYSDQAAFQKLTVNLAESMEKSE